ncbi:ribosome small subunit-dependent GTPase A [Trueperella bialowiezensis]|uniref:Small ribosomal subunit biogenesis GTPase RsgA n=1 Tax=Trueperella bialowiezensis TaxID=312285 RepID=A0A448PG37_9ACTO|nr:ribosome small subunit-dependent GTPase A [Trueperella bialowiezensis]VEI13895.1 Putative ribosome biogenesis GTPase RsgA [Trueperella bialowiezensis]
MSDILTSLGWTSAHASQFSALCQFSRINASPGRVVAVDRDSVQIATEAGRRRFHLTTDSPGGHTWPPVIGDWVAVEQSKIAFVLPRNTFLERPSSKRGHEGQPVAANIDVLLIVEPLPQFSLSRVERMAAIARFSGVEAWLIATKADLVGDGIVDQVRGDACNVVDKFFVTSTGDLQTFDSLKRELAFGRNAVVFGRSGAGKSTLINIMTGTDLPTQAVRQEDGKGRHTTTRRTLTAANGFILIDSPGVRELAAVEDPAAIEEVFSDIVEAAEDCYFSDCTHSSEPDCAVLEMIANGVIDPERLERYQRMLREARRNDPAYAQQQRRDERRASKNASRGRRWAMAQKNRFN